MSAPCTLIEEQFSSEEEKATPAAIALSRRTFLKAAAAVTSTAGLSAAALAETVVAGQAAGAGAGTEQAKALVLRINGVSRTLTLDTRTTLLDALRENLELTGSKKGCDHGQCGACTVLLDGRRVNACLTLACAAEGSAITTVEGLAHGEGIENLHPVQAAYLEHDAFQCGYCTPGQICSTVALLDEQKRKSLSIVSYHSGHTDAPVLSDNEIRERMSGNLCRCGAYPNIVAAVRAAAKAQGLATEGVSA